MRKVVFDLDDTLWNQTKRACKLADVNYHKIRNFVVKDNPYLTDDEKVRLLNIYKNPVLWSNINWISGADQIYFLEMLAEDVKVYIVSNCMNEEIRRYKRSFLSKALGIPDKQIILNVEKSAKEKVLPDDMYIFVDDSPFNIEKSTAKYTIIPNKPWNQKVQNPNTELFRFNDFSNMMEFIKLLIIGQTQKEIYI